VASPAVVAVAPSPFSSEESATTFVELALFGAKVTWRFVVSRVRLHSSLACDLGSVVLRGLGLEVAITFRRLRVSVVPIGLVALWVVARLLRVVARLLRVVVVARLLRVVARLLRVVARLPVTIPAVTIMAVFLRVVPIL